MPRYSRRYRRGPRRRTLGSRTTRKVATRAAKRVFSRMTETKYYDVVSSGVGGQTCSALDNPILLSGVDLGDTEDTRDGDEVVPMSMVVRLTLKSNVAVTGATPVRITLVRMRQLTNTTGAGLYGEVIYDPDAVTFGNTILAPYNRQLRTQYEVLYDRRFMTAPDSVGHNVLIRLGRKHLRRINWQDTSGNEGVNQIYMFVRSDQASTGDSPTFVYWSRMMYKDA